MPTTRYVDDSLSFLPSQQWNQHSLYYQGMCTAVSSGGANSSESETSTSEYISENFNSPLQSPDTTTVEDAIGPYLHLVEPPVESCRFRYPTEMKGTHGSILGISSTKKDSSRRKTYPTVQVMNYNPSSPGNQIIIRCTLTTADTEMKDRVPHVHLLKGKGVTPTSQGRAEDIDDPIDVHVSASDNYRATFPNLTILFIKKDVQLKELVLKKKRHIQRMYPDQELFFNADQEVQIMQEARKEVSKMNQNRLNTACLKFEALESVQGRLTPICPAIYSNPIKNIKSAQFNDLKICRIDKIFGKCQGGEEVFILVEKVNKKDIKVRFFEVNENDKEVWHEYAEFGEDDVHYQYAIAFRTPKYKNVEITNNVLVYFQLERPSDGSRSDRKAFEYTPDPDRWREEVRKRPRRESPPIPATVQDMSRSCTSCSASSYSRPYSTSSSEMRRSESSSAASMEIDDILKDFDLDFPTNLLDELEDQERNSSIKSSLSECISSIPSADSEMLLKMIKSPDAFSNWARYNGVDEGLMQQITNEVNAEDFETRLHQDELVADGAVPAMAWATFQMGGCGAVTKPTRPVVDQMEWAEHQGVLEIEPQMASVDTGSQYQSKNQNTFKATYLTGKRFGPNNIRFSTSTPAREKLTTDNIVTKVDLAVNKLLKLKKNKKLQDKEMKNYLLGIFSCPVGINNDRVMHILASNSSFPPMMLTFLNILKIHDIAETVVNLKNNQEQTALHVAAEKGSLQYIALLVDCGADVNARDAGLNTPVHLVANRVTDDAFLAVGHILERNPDLSICNREGLTALHVFVQKRKSDVISSLIMKSEDRNVKVDVINLADRKQGNTALHMAVQKKFLEIVNLLLNFEDRIDVNAKNFEDKTPLAYVASGESVDDLKIEELLLANHADPSLVFSRGDKVSKEVKNEVDSDEEMMSEVDEEENFDESLPSYALDWKSDAELQLMDKNTICSVCPILDENKNWVRLMKRLDFDEDLYRILEMKWSPSLFLLKAVVETKSNITSETLRDMLIKINPECKKAAQFIDDMILRNMGVFS